MELKKYSTEEQALRALTFHLMELMAQKSDGPFNLALSGGGTAQKMYSLWVNEYTNEMDLARLHFYWVDERCVPPADPESNYGRAEELLFVPLRLPESHIFRIKGEKNPEEEASRYSSLVREHVPASAAGIPVFDCIVLGVGSDLHTASIFPNTPDLIADPRLYAVSRHPDTGQHRITMTGSLLLSGAPLLVPILGKGKEPVVRALQQKYDPLRFYPAIHFLTRAARATVYVGE